MDPFATLTIDDESEPGAWAELLPYLVNCRVSNYVDVDATSNARGKNDTV
jgi:hypothetical protein